MKSNFISFLTLIKSNFISFLTLIKSIVTAVKIVPTKWSFCLQTIFVINFLRNEKQLYKFPYLKKSIITAVKIVQRHD